MEFGRKKRITIYKIGLDSNSYSQWNDDNEILSGWGMVLAIDSIGNIKGINKNDRAECTEKTYSGTLKNNIFSIRVFFKVTGQENEYLGKISDDSVFRGTFKMIIACGKRKSGETGTIFGKVNIY